MSSNHRQPHSDDVCLITSHHQHWRHSACRQSRRRPSTLSRARFLCKFLRPLAGWLRFRRLIPHKPTFINHRLAGHGVTRGAVRGRMESGVYGRQQAHRRPANKPLPISRLWNPPPHWTLPELAVGVGSLKFACGRNGQGNVWPQCLPVSLHTVRVASTRLWSGILHGCHVWLKGGWGKCPGGGERHRQPPVQSHPITPFRTHPPHPSPCACMCVLPSSFPPTGPVDLPAAALASSPHERGVTSRRGDGAAITRLHARISSHDLTGFSFVPFHP